MNTSRKLARLFLFPLALLLAFQAAAGPPRIVVVISLDQVRYDLIDRFAPWFTTRGFKRLIEGSARFTNARYRHAVAFTGPGHAAIGTGLTAAESGIVGNSWFERDAAVDVDQWAWYFDDITSYRSPAANTAIFVPEGDWWWKAGGSPRYCAYDARVKVTAGKTSGMSPVNLSADGIGDRFKERYPQARVIGLAIKDRAAILMAGRRADAAYWFDYHVPAWVSSTYYRYNPDVLAFNSAVPGYFPASAQWSPSPFIPAADLQRATFDPPAAWPLKNNTYGGTFPHPIKVPKALTYSPFTHELVLDFAQHVIATEHLGSHPGTPDLLFVGVSSTDYIGHYYGPDSMEVADSMVRLDRDLGGFLDALERRFGDDVLVVLTADHGVTNNPEIVKLRDPKADVGRLDLRTPDPRARFISDLPPTRIDVERALARKLGVPFSTSAPLTDALVYFFEEPALWLNWHRIETLGVDPERAKRALRDVMLSMKDRGIDEVWTSTQLQSPNPHATRAEQLMRASFRSDRSGDVLMALRPGWIWMWGTNSTTHGQPVENDLHVPLIFKGPGITPGTYDVDASPNDLAATLGALLGFEAGGRQSHVLPCVQHR